MAEAPTPRWRRALSWLLLIAGFGLLVGLVVEAGPATVWAAMVAAGPWLPVIIALGGGWFLGEVIAHRTLLEDQVARMPLGELVRINLVAFAIVSLAPLGKAGAEIARAVSVARRVGAPQAVAAAANVQAASLLGNALVSVPCTLAVMGLVGPSSVLPWLVLGNAALTGTLGAVTLVLARRGRLGDRLSKRFPSLEVDGAGVDEALRVRWGTFGRAVLATFAARLAQTAQLGVIVLAIGGGFSVTSALATQGVGLVGAGFGDFVPGQLGVVESAYRFFADALGLDAAQSVTIGLLGRASSLLLAAVALAVLAVWRPPPAEPQKGARSPT